MSLDEFVSKYLGKKIDWDGYYGGQCVDLYRQYVDEVLDFPQPRGVAGAKDFWTNYETDVALLNYYEKIPNTPDGVPNRGDVIIWNNKVGGGYGHVAIFLEGDASEFTSFDQNWPTLDKCTKTTHNYTNVYGWLKPKGSSDPCAELKKKVTSLEDELDDMRESRDKWKAQYKELETKYANDINALKTQNESLQKINSELTTQLGLISRQVETLTSDKNALEANVASYKAQLKTAEDNLSSLGQQFTGLNLENADLREQIVELKKKVKGKLCEFPYKERVLSLIRCRK